MLNDNRCSKIKNQLANRGSLVVVDMTWKISSHGVMSSDASQVRDRNS
jgi:hypothetical protein